jgi:hypothetical protein
VEGTCNDAELDPLPLQRWAADLMNLDPVACPDAVQSVTSRWSGQLLFQDGLATDERTRASTFEMDLTLDCLNASFGVNLREDRLATLCPALSSTTRECSPVPGGCRCSGSRESTPRTSGSYGVSGSTVVIGSASGLESFDYCVEGDLLHWQEPDTLQHLILRRAPGSGAPVPARDPR